MSQQPSEQPYPAQGPHLQRPNLPEEEIPTQRIPRVQMADPTDPHSADPDFAYPDPVNPDFADPDRENPESADPNSADLDPAEIGSADPGPSGSPTQRQMPPQQDIAPVPAQKPAKAKHFGFLALGITTLVALLVGALLGSSRDVGAVTAQPAATVTATATATATATMSKPTSEPSGKSRNDRGDDESKVSKFDQYHSYTDGVGVTVTAAKMSIIPPLAAGGSPGNPMAIVTVKIKNRSKKAFDTDLVSVNLTYGTSGKQGKDVFAPGVEGFEGTIAKGRSRSAEYAFAVPKKGMNNMVVVINRGLKYSPAIFAGKAS